MSYLSNPWITFLRQYGPIPRNDNMYDESIQRALRRSRAQPVEFDAPQLADLLQNFRDERPFSVILTGTAGDGKTFLCRKVWEGLGGDARAWDDDSAVRTLTLPGGRLLTIVKDLSELRDEANTHLTEMAKSICGDPTTSVYLVAANDGQLMEAWARLPSSPAVDSVRATVEELLVTNRTVAEGFALRLVNLSRSSAAEQLQRIITAMLQHPGWNGCNGCLGQSPDPEHRCPIWENYGRLQETLFQQRLNDILRLCDHNEYHLPVRQLLMLVSNTILGHPEAKDFLLRCIDVPRIVEQQKTSAAAPYSNVFGENLSSSRRESVEAFEVLSRFGLGEETSNRIDNLLIYGSDDASLTSSFNALVGADTVYGATPRYRAIQAGYLEEGNADVTAEFLALLRRQRQRLFFTVPDDMVVPIRLWDLTVFQFAGEYLHEVYAALRQGQRAPRHVLARLTRGMNRVFTGMLTRHDRQLVLATSGSVSQARVSRIEEAVIEVEPSRGQRVTLELVEDRLQLVVYLDRDTPVRLPLHLVRYEFLSRVAEGALPSSFSRECYEDILAFKSRLLREYRLVVRDRYGDTPEDPDDLHLKLLQLDARGLMTSRPIEVHL
jgi:hypothetical protein